MSKKINAENEKTNGPPDLVQINREANCCLDSDSWVPRETGSKPFRCVFCGAPSWLDPSDQTPPPDYCHESDHGENPNPCPWVIVENPGTDDENIVIDFGTVKEAYRYLATNYEEDDVTADVMRRNDDGTLTTMF